MEEAGNRMSQTRPSLDVGSEAWLNRITTNKANMDSINMLPVAGQGQFDPEVMKRDVGSLYKRLKRMDRYARAQARRTRQIYNMMTSLSQRPDWRCCPAPRRVPPLLC